MRVSKTCVSFETSVRIRVPRWGTPTEEPRPEYGDYTLAGLEGYMRPYSKLLVSPLITPVVVPYIIPYITPFKET